MQEVVDISQIRHIYIRNIYIWLRSDTKWTIMNNSFNTHNASKTCIDIGIHFSENRHILFNLFQSKVDLMIQNPSLLNKSSMTSGELYIGVIEQCWRVCLGSTDKEQGNWWELVALSGVEVFHALPPGKTLPSFFSLKNKSCFEINNCNGTKPDYNISQSNLYQISCALLGFQQMSKLAYSHIST